MVRFQAKYFEISEKGVINLSIPIATLIGLNHYGQHVSKQKKVEDSKNTVINHSYNSKGNRYKIFLNDYSKINWKFQKEESLIK